MKKEKAVRKKRGFLAGFKNKEGKFDLVEVKARIRSFLFGFGDKDGFIKKFMIYALLIIFGFVFLYPVLYMLITSFKSFNDLLDTAVKWIPKEATLQNYVQAFETLKFKEVIGDSLLLALIPSICQTVSCALAGYAFQRFDFPLKKLFFVILIITFIIPAQITMIPTYLQYLQMSKTLGIEFLGTMKVFILPALFGQGFKSAIIVLVFFQFFKTIPKSLDEAAQLDGAGHFKIFYKIAIRAAIPAFIVSFIFSFVWYWNETYLTNLFLGNSNVGASSMSTLLLELRNFSSNYEEAFGGGGGSAGAGTAGTGYGMLNNAITMSGTMLALAPVLLLYFIMQRYFVEGVERTGITGE